MTRTLNARGITDRLPSVGAIITGLMAVVMMMGWRGQIEKTNKLAEDIARITSIPPQAVPARIFRHTAENGDQVSHLVIYRPGYAEVFDRVDHARPATGEAEFTIASDEKPAAKPWNTTSELVLNFK